ncbi:MAG: GNAT family N-acetyltransferase, partial [Candidatus Bathyarchaeia archaeon]
MKIEIVNLREDNVNDALLVCTSPKLRNDENVKIGLEIRRSWLLDLCRRVGPCGKIAYVEDKPAGMIQYSPLHAVPYFQTKRRDVLYIHCIYVKRNLRNRGIGSALL